MARLCAVVLSTSALLLSSLLHLKGANIFQHLNSHHAHFPQKGRRLLSETKTDESTIETFTLIQPSCTDEDLDSLMRQLDGVLRYIGSPGGGGLCFLVVDAINIGVVRAAFLGGAFTESRGAMTVEVIKNLSIPETGARENSPDVAPLSGDGGWGLDVPWHLDMLDDTYDNTFAPGADGDGVHAYVFDTGIRTSHTEFGGRAVPTLEVNKYYIRWCPSSAEDDCAIDRVGRGTHVAGILGGAHSGVAKKVTLHAVKVLDDTGFGTSLEFLKAMNIILQNAEGSGKIITMSPAVSVSVAVGIALRVATDFRGFIVVVAAGNGNDKACRTALSAFSSDSVITVGAINQQFKRPRFSNFGRCVDIFAPGSAILAPSVSSDDDFGRWSGTGMACPMVAGAAALLLQTRPELSPGQVARVLKEASKSGIKNKKRYSPNRRLYWSADLLKVAAPPSTKVRVTRGRCKVKAKTGDKDKICIVSKGRFRTRGYNDWDYCHIEVPTVGFGPITMKYFRTELELDYLTLNEMELSGEGEEKFAAMKSLVDGKTLTRDIYWLADESHAPEKGGWKICNY